MRYLEFLFAVGAIVSSLAGFAAAVGPISGERFERLLDAQDTVLQRRLESIFPGEQGFLVTGPLDPLTDYYADLKPYFNCVRVVCPDLEHYDNTDKLLNQAIKDGFVNPVALKNEVNVGGMYAFKNGDAVDSFLVVTLQQTRFLIWLRQAAALNDGMSVRREPLNGYIDAVSVYLARIDSGRFDAPSPVAADFGLDTVYDIYAPSPDYVIEGYQNYKNYLHGFAAIKTNFISGVTAFVPTSETLANVTAAAPREAYPNKEAAKFQEEMKKYSERGGDLSRLRTLTREAFDTLSNGEYFFAVALSGKVRFGKELLREEVDRIERETGQKVPRANHATLLPGEPVLTAGAFFIDVRGDNRLAEINAQSGHYFYSNIQPTIKEDISVRSDKYFLTLGHFLKALERLGISCDGVLLSKL